MMSESHTLFELGCEPVKPRLPEANDDRGLDCWSGCGHCGMTTHTDPHQKPAKKYFRLCHLDLKNPKRVHAADEFCDYGILREPEKSRPVVPPSPQMTPPVRSSTGWEDF